MSEGSENESLPDIIRINHEPQVDTGKKVGQWFNAAEKAREIRIQKAKDVRQKGCKNTLLKKGAGEQKKWYNRCNVSRKNWAMSQTKKTKDVKPTSNCSSIHSSVVLRPRAFNARPRYTPPPPAASPPVHRRHLNSILDLLVDAKAKLITAITANTEAMVCIYIYII